MTDNIPTTEKTNTVSSESSQVNLIMESIDRIINMNHMELPSPQAHSVGTGKNQDEALSSDRIARIEEAVTKSAQDMDQLRQCMGEVHRMCLGHIELSKANILRQDTTNKNLLIQYSEVKGLLKSLGTQIHSLQQKVMTQSSTVGVSIDPLKPIRESTAFSGVAYSTPAAHDRAPASPYGSATATHLPLPTEVTGYSQTAAVSSPTNVYVGSPLRVNTSQPRFMHSPSPDLVSNYQQQILQQHKLAYQQQQQQMQQYLAQQAYAHLQKSSVTPAGGDQQTQLQARELLEQQQQVQRQAEEHARKEAAERTKLEAEESARKETEVRAKKESEEQARKAAEECEKAQKAQQQQAESQARMAKQQQLRAQLQQNKKSPPQSNITIPAAAATLDINQALQQVAAAMPTPLNSTHGEPSASVVQGPDLTSGPSLSTAKQTPTDKLVSTAKATHSAATKESTLGHAASNRVNSRPSASDFMQISSMKPVSLVSPPKRTKPAETQSKASTTANAQKTGAVEPKKQPASSVTSSKSADAVQATHASIPNPKKSLLETTPSSISNRPEIPEVISEAQARSIRAQLAAANAKNKEHALTKYKRQSPALSNSSLESGQLRDRGTLKTPSHSSDHHQSSLDRRSHPSRRDQNQGVHAGWDVSSRDLSQDNRSDSWSYSRSKSRDSAGQNSKPQSSTHSAAKLAKVPTSELATKGGTKHHIDGTDERSPKRRQVSPRVTNAIMFSDVSSSGSESSDDFQSIYSGVQAHGISYAKTESNPRDGSKMTIEIKGSSGGSRASPTGNGSAVDIASRLGPSLSDYSSGSSNIAMRLGHYSADSDMGTDSYRPPRYSDGRHTPNSLDSESEWDGKGGENLIASQRSALRDCSGHVIDTERLDILFGPFVFVGLQSFPHLYNMYFGCQPLRPGIRRHILQRSLTSLAQFKYMDPNVRSPDGTYEKADFIARTGKAFLQAQRRIKKRLFSGAVPAPLVFCCLVQLICCQQNSLNSNMVDNMFRHVTQKRLHDLLVITKRGVNTYSSSQLWDMAKDWLFDLTKHITRSRNAVGSLGLADQLHTRYVDQCCKNSSDISNPDPTGKIAQKLLESEADAELFLGLRSSDLNQLYRYLVFLMSKNVSRVDSIYLKEVSSSFINVK